MLAISLDTEVEYNPQQSHLTLPELELIDVGDVNTDGGDLSEELSLDDLQDIEQEEDIEIAAVDPQNLVGNNRRSTDLVRVYLQEIGKVRLLGRDEEVGEAQKVQRHLKIRLLLANAAKQGDALVVPYLQLIEVQERLVSELGHRPSLERWASTAGIKLVDLKPTLSEGKRRWAEIAKLTVEELDQIQSQGIQAKEHMIKANLRLVVSVAKKYQNRGLELLDLVQEGTLGLERAVEKFDPTKGYRFSTYAYWWIRQGITRAIATSSRTIRLPVHITEKLNKIKKAQRKIAQEKGRTPTLEDLALELDMTPNQVREVLLRVPRSVSLETKVGKDKDTELGELLETDTITPEETLMRESLQKDIHHLLSDLTTREREVILMRFGLADGHSYSLAEIGRALELSRERVRQIESKALQKLRQPKRRNLVRDYLESLS
ncbi:RNA polymerase sigma factor SigC [Cylindrospermopsis raciborskii]|uniref:RNA polymerase sigma factor n=2 Tax=Cylindrospermopsis raciborskii TaxID=77022 RepID=A0A838WPX3_9CYAN|nr:RNA polymerase sigma factor SigC [Cylindrospermopsis raciborskii]EFA70011.1 sigC (Sigma 28 (Flagella/Sporulation)) [Cylindrospermopsis raciborskii CS-505]MBA4446051.1 RNA polymerase sigma factor SigC [Cylindrospermopsis raciborskii CS-506_C]MBA4450279.1 RNA polymerase sigma factor SigC [Cylindrospermopsis raciborskii CS-506_D]MBA4456904.1 RNA polymerase sigma factor SigC [Cylindrospermopsis raciborskii CS-506_B]MBA4466260.1 RNA polymerase sigma factor SigC [Cylindrospermopsis raciborskii CS